MALTAASLIKMPECGSKIIAGHGGQHRPISWAHSCEEPEPWKWLGDSNLLMTTGIAIPANAIDQCRYAEQCAMHGIVGVAIGQDMNAPRLTQEFLDCANQLNFVVILTQREIPFIVLSRAIADSEQQDERTRLRRSKRLYEAVLQTTIDQDRTLNRLEMVGKAIGYTVRILNQEDHTRTPTDWSDPIPGGTPNLGTLDLPIPGFPNTKVRLLPQGPEFAPLDQGIRQHISLIAALELERETAEREKAYRRSSSLLGSFVDGVDTKDLEERALSMLDFTNESYYLAVGSRIHQGIRLFRELLDSGYRNAIYPHGDTTYIVLPSEDKALELVISWVKHIGVSEKFHSFQEARTSMGQAYLAHKSALKRDIPLVHFSERRASIVPDSAPAADLLVEQTLGRLQEYDAKQGTAYVHSLRIFLEENRSWNMASERLHVHKQTLVYRMRRVTEMTGLHLDRTADVALFWAALEALNIYR